VGFGPLVDHSALYIGPHNTYSVGRGVGYVTATFLHRLRGPVACRGGRQTGRRPRVSKAGVHPKS